MVDGAFGCRCLLNSVARFTSRISYTPHLPSSDSSPFSTLSPGRSFVLDSYFYRGRAASSPSTIQSLFSGRSSPPLHSGRLRRSLRASVPSEVRLAPKKGAPVSAGIDLLKLDDPVFQQDDVYLFRLEDAVQIKRLKRIEGNCILIISDNDSYRDRTLTLNEGIDFEVLGRVLV